MPCGSVIRGLTFSTPAPTSQAFPHLCVDILPPREEYLGKSASIFCKVGEGKCGREFGQGEPPAGAACGRRGPGNGFVNPLRASVHCLEGLCVLWKVRGPQSDGCWPRWPLGDPTPRPVFADHSKTKTKEPNPDQPEEKTTYHVTPGVLDHTTTVCLCLGSGHWTHQAPGSNARLTAGPGTGGQGIQPPTKEATHQTHNVGHCTDIKDPVSPTNYWSGKKSGFVKE